MFYFSWKLFLLHVHLKKLNLPKSFVSRYFFLKNWIILILKQVTAGAHVIVQKYTAQ